jgi:hypothetical protein
VKSLEVVIQRFLELAEQRTEDAQKSSIEKVEEIDDLDQADAPEKYASLMHSCYAHPRVAVCCCRRCPARPRRIAWIARC